LETKYFYSNEQNGLSKSWDRGGSVYVNPLYGRDIGKWVQKGATESLTNNVTVVMLLPARPDTRWFHNHIWNKEHNQPRENVQIRFLKGRVKFEAKCGLPNDAPFPSMIVVFRPENNFSNHSLDVTRSKHHLENETSGRQLTLRNGGFHII
jgi:hypothetical protein